MKNTMLILLGMVVVLAMGASETVIRTDRFGWETMGETTTAYTTPAVNERDYTNLVANHADAVVFTLAPYRWNAILMRFVVDDDADDTVFDLFASKGQDHFTRIATLTLKGGTQVGPATSTATTGGVFVDTITITNEFWYTTLHAVDGAGADRIASLRFDACGFDTFALVGTTVDDTTLVQATGY